MGTETTDIIDDVLKESEELLDRIKHNDIYDGGASFASLGSEVYSVRSTTGIGTHVVLDAPPVGPTATPLSLKSDDGSLLSGHVSAWNGKSLVEEQRSVDPLATVSIVAKWEKVASATAGDDDYVPLVDYTKEKRTHQDHPIVSVKSKVSRLEAYREKSRKRRRRRTMMITIITTLLTIVWWWVRSKGNRATTSSDNQDLGNFMNDTNEAGIVGVSSDDLLDDIDELETCPWDCIADFSLMLDEFRCSQGGIIDIIALEANNTKDDGLDGSNQTTDRNSSSPSKTVVRWRSDEKKCRNPIVRLFSKKCRILWREKKKALQESGAFQ